MNIFASLAILFAAGFAVPAYGQEPGTGGPKILVAYFSKTGTTRAVAEMVHARVGGDLFRIVPKDPYPENYTRATEVAREELNSNARPELAESIPPGTMSEYDVVFIGYPIWWGTMPMVVFTFLEQHDLSGKTIVPFCTHGGSGAARGPADIAASCPDSTVGEVLAVRGGSTANAGNDVDAWLRRLGYGK